MRDRSGSEYSIDRFLYSCLSYFLNQLGLYNRVFGYEERKVILTLGKNPSGRLMVSVMYLVIVVFGQDFRMWL